MTTSAQLKMHYEWPSQLHSLRTLHLFAGIGGGLLADNILGHYPVCAVEIDTYCQQSLAARQTNGSLPWFPIFGDVQAFDGKPWRGLVDAICGGFPCTDISSSGKSAGLDGKNSGLWREFARILGEVRPQYAFIENSPRLASLGLNRYLQTLPRSGLMFNGVVYRQPKSAPTMGEIVYGLLPKSRKPAYSTPTATDALGGGSAKLALLYLSGDRTTGAFVQEKLRDFVKLPRNDITKSDKTARIVGDTGLPGQLAQDWDECLMGFPVGWTDVSATKVRPLDWSVDLASLPIAHPNYMARVVQGRLPNRKPRIKAIGNAQVPLCAAVAFTILKERFLLMPK